MNIYCKTIEQVVFINKKYNIWTDPELLQIFKMYGYKLIIIINNEKFDGFNTYAGFFVKDSVFNPQRKYIDFEEWRKL